MARTIVDEFLEEQQASGGAQRTIVDEWLEENAPPEPNIFSRALSAVQNLEIERDPALSGGFFVPGPLPQTPEPTLDDIVSGAKGAVEGGIEATTDFLSDPAPTVKALSRDLGDATAEFLDRTGRNVAEAALAPTTAALRGRDDPDSNFLLETLGGLQVFDLPFAPLEAAVEQPAARVLDEETARTVGDFAPLAGVSALSLLETAGKIPQLSTAMAEIFGVPSVRSALEPAAVRPRAQLELPPEPPLSPAEASARAIEDELLREERLVQSPEGGRLLRERLAQEAAAAGPEVAPPPSPAEQSAQVFQEAEQRLRQSPEGANRLAEELARQEAEAGPREFAQLLEEDFARREREAKKIQGRGPRPQEPPGTPKKIRGRTAREAADTVSPAIERTELPPPEPEGAFNPLLTADQVRELRESRPAGRPKKIAAKRVRRPTPPEEPATTPAASQSIPPEPTPAPAAAAPTRRRRTRKGRTVETNEQGEKVITVEAPAPQRTASQRQTLSNFFLRPDAEGKAQTISIDKSDLKGELFAPRETSPKARRLITKGRGISINQAMERAFQEGFIEDETTEAFLKALRDDLRGQDVRSSKGVDLDTKFARQEAREEADRVAQLEEDFIRQQEAEASASDFSPGDRVTHTQADGTTTTGTVQSVGKSGRVSIKTDQGKTRNVKPESVSPVPRETPEAASEQFVIEPAKGRGSRGKFVVRDVIEDELVGAQGRTLELPSREAAEAFVERMAAAEAKKRAPRETPSKPKAEAEAEATPEEPEPAPTTKFERTPEQKTDPSLGDQGVVPGTKEGGGELKLTQPEGSVTSERGAARPGEAIQKDEDLFGSSGGSKSFAEGEAVDFTSATHPDEPIRGTIAKRNKDGTFDIRIGEGTGVAKGIDPANLKKLDADDDVPFDVTPLSEDEIKRLKETESGLDLAEGEIIDPNVTKLGTNLSIPDQATIYRGLFARAKRKRARERAANAERIHPNIELQVNEADMGWPSYFGTPSNVFKSARLTADEIMSDLRLVGARGRRAIIDLNLTELDIRVDFGRRMEEVEEIFKSIPKRAWGKRGELFFDLFDGKPIKEIEARTDLSDATKGAARKLRDRLDKDRRMIIGRLRDRARPVAEQAVKERLKGKRVGAEERARLVDEELRTIVPDSWGIRDYLPHVIPGDFRLMRDGVAFGSARTRLEALSKIAEDAALHDNPGQLNYTVQSRSFMNPDLLRVSTARRGVFLSQLADAAEISSKEAAEAARGIISTKSARQKFNPNLVKRTGAEGAVKDMRFIMETYNRNLTRWAHLSDLNQRVQPLIESMRKSGLDNTPQEIESLLQNLWGYKSASSKALDNSLARTKGIRVIHRPFALERWSQRARSLTAGALLKYSPRFRALNSLQTIETLLPISSVKEMAKAGKQIATGQAKDVLERHGVRFFTQGGRAADVSSRFRLGAEERFNQELAFMVMYNKARKLGATDAQAAQYGILRGNIHSQFLGLTSDQSRVFARSIQHGTAAPVKATTFGMFKRFPVKNMELGLELLRQRDYPGMAKYVAAKMLIGGTRGLTRPAFLVPGAGYLAKTVYDDIKKEHGEDVANVINVGLPGLAGVDFSYSIQMWDIPFGRTIGERIGNMIAGPLIGMGIGIAQKTADTKGVEPDASTRALRATIDRTPALRWMLALEQVFTGDYDFKDPSGRLKFKADFGDVMRKGMAFRTTKEAADELVVDAWSDLMSQAENIKDYGAAHYAKARLEDRDIDADEEKAIIESLDKWNEAYPAFPITIADLLDRADRRFQRAQKSQVERIIERGPQMWETEFKPTEEK